jgi:hypothetical protein
MDNFLPQDYKEPQGNYVKLPIGRTQLRILSSAVIGWEYWNKENKPIRQKDAYKGVPADAGTDSQTGKVKKPQHFWAFIVWNYTAEQVQLMQITQKSLQSSIRALIEDPAWGNPKEYDIVITKSGSGFDTDYKVMPSPKSKAPEVDVSYIDLQALFTGKDPFAGKSELDKTAEEFAQVPDKKKK